MENIIIKLNDNKIDFDSFKCQISNSLFAYITGKDKITGKEYKGSKSPFLNCNFNNIRLKKTPNVRDKKEKNIDNPEHQALSKMQRAIYEMFLIVMGMFEASKNHEEIYKTIYSYADKSYTDKKGHNVYQEYKYLKEPGFKFLDKDTGSYLPANLDEEYTKKLLYTFINRANDVKVTPEKMPNANNSRFFLLGYKGTGKTAFLNNIFSRYYKDLKDNDIFWIRVDLTKTHFNNKTLVDTMYFQVAKIFREHYFIDFLEDEKNKFKEDIEDYVKKQQGVVNEKFYKAYEVFESIPRVQEIESFDRNIETGINHYLEQRKGMIYIFDGLDRIDDDQDQKFKEKMDAISEIILGTEKYNGLFIFVMRDSSHHEYLYHKRGDIASLRNSYRIFSIVPPELEEIIDKRINLLFDKWNTYFSKEKFIKSLHYSDEELDKEREDNEINDVRNKLSTFTKNEYQAYLHVFLLFLYTGIRKYEVDDVDNFLNEIKDWKKKDAFTELKNLFGNDYRKLLDIIKYANKKFLEAIERSKLQIEDVFNIGYDIMPPEEEDKKVRFKIKLKDKCKNDLKKLLKRTYLIVDFLLRGDNASYENPYAYEYISSNNIRSECNKDDKPYLYNLYYSINVEDVEEEQFYFLLKIRVLQYISIMKGKTYTETNIVDFFYEKFGYSKDRTLIAFEELRDYGLIISMIQSDNVSLSYIYKLSGAGKYHLKTLISAFSYIRIIINDILIPEQFYDLFMFHKVFRNKDSQNERDVEYIIQHYPRMINFISMLYAFEKIEKGNMVGMSDKEKSDWDIFTKVFEQFIDTIAKVLWKYDKKLEYFNKVLTENREKNKNRVR